MSAPAICVVLVDAMSASVVVDIRSRRDLRRLSSMSAKGRYLFASSRMAGLSPSMSTSPDEDGVRGYSHSAR